MDYPYSVKKERNIRNAPKTPAPILWNNVNHTPNMLTTMSNIPLTSNIFENFILSHLTYIINNPITHPAKNPGIELVTNAPTRPNNKDVISLIISFSEIIIHQLSLLFLKNYRSDSLTPQEKVLEPIKVNEKPIDLKLLDKILSIFDQRITVGEVRKVLRFLGGMS